MPRVKAEEPSLAGPLAAVTSNAIKFIADFWSATIHKNSGWLGAKIRAQV